MKVLGQQKPRQLLGLFEQALRDADVDQQQARRHVLLREQWRQGLAVHGLRCITLAQAEHLQGVRGNPGAARRAEKFDDPLDRHRLPGHCRIRRQRHRLDAHHLNALVFVALECQPALQYRRHRPALTAQLDKPALGKQRTVRRTQAGLRFAADHLAGPRIAVACLAVQCLDAGEQTGGQPQPGQHTEKLHGMAPPVAEQRAQGLPPDHQATRPLDNTTRWANRAATRWL